jgi:large subunit ribosomal protein L23
MALFNKKKEEKKDEVVKETTAKKEVAKKAPTKAPAVKTTTKEDLSWVLVRPRITEKGTITAPQSNAYIFEVSMRSNKTQIKEAIIEQYKVTPTKVNVLKIPSKKKFARGKKGTKSGGKKAYIFLKKGDSIQFV